MTEFKPGRKRRASPFTARNTDKTERAGYTGERSAERSVGGSFKRSGALGPKHETKRSEKEQGIWLYGFHAVAAALANPERQLKRLIVTEEGLAGLEKEFSAPLPLTPEVKERIFLEKIIGSDAVHQGVILQVLPLKNAYPEDLVKERPGPVLILDQVSDPRNIGAVLRSAAAFGAAFVAVQDRRTPEETGAMAKAASGALEIVPLVRVTNIARLIEKLKEAGFWVVGLDSEGLVFLSQIDFGKRRQALVLGAEGEGLRRNTAEKCDETAALPMKGRAESLNVSVAASVALYELVRLET